MDVTVKAEPMTAQAELYQNIIVTTQKEVNDKIGRHVTRYEYTNPNLTN